jgi:hypothetical protein
VRRARRALFARHGWRRIKLCRSLGADGVPTPRPLLVPRRNARRATTTTIRAHMCLHGRPPRALRNRAVMRAVPLARLRASRLASMRMAAQQGIGRRWATEWPTWLQFWACHLSSPPDRRRLRTRSRRSRCACVRAKLDCAGNVVALPQPLLSAAPSSARRGDERASCRWRVCAQLQQAFLSRLLMLLGSFMILCLLLV